jgi:hypothetical protein
MRKKRGMDKTCLFYMKITIITMIGLFGLVMSLKGVAEAKQTKVDVCHVTDEGNIVEFKSKSVLNDT